MGNRNARLQGLNLANYGAGYDPYYSYGHIENYGSNYQPIGGGYPLGYGFTDDALITSVKPPLGSLGALNQGGISTYGGSYSTSFNPILQPGLNGPKIRLIYVPTHVLNGFQNLLQQGCGSGATPIVGGLGGYGYSQFMPQSPLSPMSSNCYPMSPQLPSMMPQIPYPVPCPPPMIQPIAPQMPMRKITIHPLIFFKN